MGGDSNSSGRNNWGSGATCPHPRRPSGHLLNLPILGLSEAFWLLTLKGKLCFPLMAPQICRPRQLLHCGATSAWMLMSYIAFHISCLAQSSVAEYGTLHMSLPYVCGRGGVPSPSTPACTLFPWEIFIWICVPWESCTWPPTRKFQKAKKAMKNWKFLLAVCLLAELFLGLYVQVRLGSKWLICTADFVSSAVINVVDHSGDIWICIQHFLL